MKKLIFLVLLTLLVSANAMAMKSMDHSTMATDHGSMQMAADGSMDHSNGEMGGVIMLQDDVVDGVKAAAHLMGMKGGMEPMLMVMFTDVKSGTLISDGHCALKVEAPDQKISKPEMMMMSQNMFSTGINLEQQGNYKFTVGTKLSDGQKRSFNFNYVHK